MPRRLALMTIALVAVGALLSGCGRTVQVQTGERITCTYGEVVTDTVRTVEVSADKAASYRVVSETITCDRHKQLESLYADAQAAIVAGDLATAREKLVEVITIEPLFKNARRQLDSIDDGERPTPDTGASSGSTSTAPTPPPASNGSGADQKPIGPVASLSSWVPETLPGYTSTPIVADVYSLTREYVPGAGAPTYALVAVVEQYKDATAAKRAIKGELGRSYPVGGTTTTVAGRAVYFGTDGRSRAIAAWNENGVVVAIEGAAKSGSPAGLKSHLSALVAAIVQ